MEAKKQNEVSNSERDTSVLAKEIVLIKAFLDTVKPYYDQLDKLTVELANRGVTEVEVKLSHEESVLIINGKETYVDTKQYVKIVDNFMEKNTVFRPAGVKRFESSIETGFEREERLKKEEKKKEKKKND